MIALDHTVIPLCHINNNFPFLNHKQTSLLTLNIHGTSNILHLVDSKFQFKIAHYLISKGVDWTQKDQEGVTGILVGV